MQLAIPIRQLEAREHHGHQEGIQYSLSAGTTHRVLHDRPLAKSPVADTAAHAVAFGVVMGDVGELQWY